MQHELTWYGHSAFKLETNGAVIYIDPFLDNPNSPLTLDDVAAADLVLVTHDHDDHVGQALSICSKTGAKLVSIFDTVKSLVQKGLDPAKGIGMNIGGTVDPQGIKIKMVQAAHSSATGVSAGFILTLADGFCLYHSGDTGIFSSMELFGKFHDIDLALLPIDGFVQHGRQAGRLCHQTAVR